MSKSTRSISSSLILLMSLLGCGSGENLSKPTGAVDSDSAGKSDSAGVDANQAAAVSTGTTIKVSKETTFITEPLRSDGSVDYVEALNRLASDGVTVENNAVALLAQTVGPDLFPKSMRKQFFAKLGIPEPPQQGSYFLSMSKFSKQIAGQNSRAYTDDLNKQHEKGSQTPWSPAELPKLAAWLEFNKDPLQSILEATRRSSYYFPMIASADGGSESLIIAVLLPLLQETRSISRALTARAMLAVHQGRIEEAQADLLACHRLARLTAKGQTLVEGLVGVAIESVACRAGEIMLQSGRLSDAQLLKYQQALAKLAPLWSAAQRINVAERFSTLDATTYIARQGVNGMRAISDIAGGSNGAPSPSGFGEVFSNLDWNIVLKTINDEFDQMYSAASMTRYSQRRTAMDNYNEHLKQVSNSAKRQLNELPAIGKADPKQASKVIADVLVALLLPAVEASQTAEDRGVTKLELLRVAVALEQFRKANDHFPEDLHELKPREGQKLPTDLYTEKPFLYKRTNEGYLLYSVGANQKDDGGQTSNSKPPGDDIVVRMSLEK